MFRLLDQADVGINLLCPGFSWRTTLQLTSMGVVLTSINFSGVDLLQTHAVGGQWDQWNPVTLNALVKLLLTAQPWPPSPLERTEQYHINLMSTKAATALLKGL